MLKHLSAFALTCALTLPAAATDLDNLTGPERDAFRAEVRAYLLDNPEMLMGPSRCSSKRQTEADMERDTMAVGGQCRCAVLVGLRCRSGQSRG